MNPFLACLLMLLSTALVIVLGVLLIYAMFVASGMWWLWLILIFVLIFLYRLSMVAIIDPDYMII